MGFVKTDEEMRAIRQEIFPMQFEYEGASVEFETDGAFIEEVLPPCFDPGESTVARATVSRWRSLRTVFDCTIIDLPARHQEVEGWYHLTHLISGDMAVTIGREMWGEAKKRGEMSLEVSADHVHAWGERNGVKLVEIELALGAERPARVNSQTRLELKAFLSADGQGLQSDPIVLRLEETDYADTVREASAQLVFRGSPTDPTDTIPIGRIVGAAYEKGSSVMGLKEEHPVEGRDEYVPYVWGRAYDLTKKQDLSREGAMTRRGSFAAA
jgi:acetoacetate decarboxylase